MTIGYQPVTPQASVPAGYTGIYTKEDLYNVCNDLTGKYIQMADVDLSTYGIWNALPDTAAGLASSVDGVSWGVIPKSGFRNGCDINSIATDGTKWVAVGTKGSCSVSLDGVNWTLLDTGTDKAFYSVAYGNGLWVRVGYGGRIETSTDGVTWTTQSSGFVNTLYSVYYGSNGVWIVAGSSGKFATSPNGVDWTVVDIGFSTTIIYRAIYENGLWVAVGGSGKLRTSTNGTTWTARTSQFGTSTVYDVAYSEGIWVAVGASGKLSSSTTGTSWTARTSQFGTNTIFGIKNVSGLWIIVGYAGNLATSSNGTSWTLGTSGFNTTSISAIAYGNGTWMIGGKALRGGPFTGIYDGNGYSIIGLTGDGLFDFTSSPGEIKNVKLLEAAIDNGASILRDGNYGGSVSNCYVSGSISGAMASGIAGGNYTSGEIADCTVNAAIISTSYGGGIAGANYGGKVLRCVSQGSVTGENSVGGIVYRNDATGEIDDCHSSCNVTSNTNSAGGICAESYSAIPISDSSATGNIVGVGTVGGCVGLLDKAGAESCFATGNATSSEGSVGGFAGELYGNIEACYATGNVNGAKDTGGLIGFVSMDLGEGYAVEECCSTGSVVGTAGSVGGLVGSIYNTPIKNCFSHSNVEAAAGENVGGLIGGGNCIITNSYSKGAVVGSGENVGGLVGYLRFVDDGGLLTACYYDTETSGMSDTGRGEPKTTAEMKLEATFVNWDFSSIWMLSSTTNGYPALQWQTGNDEEIPNYPPGSTLQLQFTAGDSAALQMGTFYIDSTNFRVGNDMLSISVRNVIGKYLNDQTFNESNRYTPQNLKTLLETILQSAGVANYEVAVSTQTIGMEFAPNSTFLSGINELLKFEPTWSIYEVINTDGSTTVKIGVRPAGSKYTFYRSRDVFSRAQTKNDNEAYGRVCCHDSDFAVAVYRPVSSSLGWLPPAQKTLYVEIPTGMTELEAASLASQLAEQMSDTGEVETFVGPIRPQLQPGDTAEIIDEDGPNLLGTITTVQHNFSKQGFYTEFTVDSGGRIGRPRWRDTLDRLAAQVKVAQATKLQA